MIKESITRDKFYNAELSQILIEIANKIAKPPYFMELKQEIAQIVDKLPNEVLGELLQYLRQVEKTTIEKMRLSLNLNTILTKDRDLLEKLAK